MSIMTQLEFELDFSTSEKQLANYILNHGEEVLSASIKELANKTYTSPATIVRLCHKLGLAGYADFKIKYSAELQYDNKTKKRIDVNFPFEQSDSKVQIAHKIASLHQESIEDTLKLIDFKQLDRAIQALDKANHIYIFGSGNSLLAGLSFQHKMMRIGKLVELKILTGEQVFMSYAVKPDDIAIIVSYSGETQDIVNVAKLLKRKNTPILGITSIGENQLSKYCDYVLNTCSREKIFSKIAPFSSKTSMEYIFDILFSCLFTINYHENIKEKISLDKQYDERHPSRSPVNDEG